MELEHVHFHTSVLEKRERERILYSYAATNHLVLSGGHCTEQ